MQDFVGRIAVVTGGGDGIGFALGAALAAAGMRVALLDIRADAAREAGEHIGAVGGTAIGITCDVSVDAALVGAARSVERQWGRIALLAINAGVGAPGGLLSANQRAIDWVLSVNVHGLIGTARAFHPLFEPAAAGRRHVVVTASSASLVPVDGPGLALYAASKHCAMGLAEGLAAELAPEGIGTTILCPGLINTRIWDGARARPDRFGGARHAPEEAGAYWRDGGHCADWVAQCALAAIAADARYCVPADAHIAERFAARTAAIAAAVDLPPAR